MQSIPAISRRKLALFSGLALVASLLFGLSSASQAQDQQPDCKITGPTVAESPVITGGTRITFNVTCQAGETETVKTLVQVGDTLFLQDVETVGAQAGALLDVVKDVAVGQVGLNVCVEAGGVSQCVSA